MILNFQVCCGAGPQLSHQVIYLIVSNTINVCYVDLEAS